MQIKSFSNKELENLFFHGLIKGINSNHVKKINFILDAIDSSDSILDIKSLYPKDFSEKKGSGKGVFSIKINGNWRITFQIKNKEVVYIDYHGKQIKAR